MKILFWTAVILGAMWWLSKRTMGKSNDLFAHIEEQDELNRIGDSSLGANQIGLGNWALSTIGKTPLGSNWLDPFNPDNPFATPDDLIYWQSDPAQNTGDTLISKGR